MYKKMKKFVILACGWLLLATNMLWAQPISCKTYQYDTLGVDSAFAYSSIFTYNALGKQILEVKYYVNGDIDSLISVYDSNNNLDYEKYISNGELVRYTDWDFDIENHTIFSTDYKYVDSNQNLVPVSRLRSFGINNFDSKLVIEHLGYPIYLCDSVISETYKTQTSEWRVEMIGHTIYENGRITKMICPVSNAGDSAMAYLTYDDRGNVIGVSVQSPLVPNVDLITISQTFDENNQLTYSQRFQRIKEMDNERNIETSYQYINNALIVLTQRGRNSSGQWILEEVKIYCDPLKVSECNKNSLKIYPNPVKDVFFVDDVEVGSQVFIFDMLGRLQLKTNLLSEGAVMVDISSLPTGNYVVLLENKQTLKYSTLIKN